MTRPLVLLDLDGTLLDSAPAITTSLAAAFDELGLPVPEPSVLRSLVGPPLADLFLVHGVPAEQVEDAVAVYRRVYVGGAMLETPVFDGVPEALAELRAAGLTLVLATSKPEAYASTLCDHTGLTPLLDGLAGASVDRSRTSKADVVGHALAGRGGAPARTLMVGDREHDVHGARAHGIDCLGVSWGYAAPGELAAAGAVGIVDHPRDLVAHVTAQLEELAA
jgi:phosphoglycolate phosphatase